MFPFELAYYEACQSTNDAFKREKYLKTTYGKRYLKNRLQDYLSGYSTRHPLKGPCQEKTPLHRKKIFFFCRDNVSSSKAWLTPLSLRLFFMPFWLRSLLDLQPGTHQDQGRNLKMSGLRSGEPLNSSERSNPSLFNPTPGPLNGSQKKHRYLAISNRLLTEL
jgi:hypothetical protein